MYVYRTLTITVVQRNVQLMPSITLFMVILPVESAAASANKATGMADQLRYHNVDVFVHSNERPEQDGLEYKAQRDSPQTSDTFMKAITHSSNFESIEKVTIELLLHIRS